MIGTDRLVDFQIRKTTPDIWKSTRQYKYTLLSSAPIDYYPVQQRCGPHPALQAH